MLTIREPNGALRPTQIMQIYIYEYMLFRVSKIFHWITQKVLDLEEIITAFEEIITNNLCASYSNNIQISRMMVNLAYQAR